MISTTRVLKLVEKIFKKVTLKTLAKVIRPVIKFYVVMFYNQMLAS